MPDNLPSRRISREALERVIQRAAELQANDMDTGDGLTEQELLKVGAEVGIDGRFLRQALYEQRTGDPDAEKGALARWVGPRLVSASRVVPGDRAPVEQALDDWLTDKEALAVKRRLADRTSWERQRGFVAEMKRGFGVGGMKYELAKALEVTTAVTQLEAGFSHVELSADLQPTRVGYAAGAGVMAGGGALLGAGVLAAQTVVGVTLWPLLLVWGAIAGTFGGFGWMIARSYRRSAERMQLALEQVLDRLERGEIKPRHQLEPEPLFPFGRIAHEIRRAITEVSDASRRGPHRLNP